MVTWYFILLIYPFLSVMVALMSGVFPRHSVKYFFPDYPDVFLTSYN